MDTVAVSTNISDDVHADNFLSYATVVLYHCSPRLTATRMMVGRLQLADQANRPRMLESCLGRAGGHRSVRPTDRTALSWTWCPPMSSNLQDSNNREKSQSRRVGQYVVHSVRVRLMTHVEAV